MKVNDDGEGCDTPPKSHFLQKSRQFLVQIYTLKMMSKKKSNTMLLSENFLVDFKIMFDFGIIVWKNAETYAPFLVWSKLKK